MMKPPVFPTLGTLGDGREGLFASIRYPAFGYQFQPFFDCAGNSRGMNALCKVRGCAETQIFYFEFYTPSHSTEL